jgi:hypothetical protein
LQIAHRITNDSDTVVNDLLTGLSKLAITTCLCCQVDNNRSGWSSAVSPPVVPTSDSRFIASTCSFKIKRGAGLPAADQHATDMGERTDQSGRDDDVDLLGLSEEKSHLRIDEFLLISISIS